MQRILFHYMYKNISHVLTKNYMVPRIYLSPSHVAEMVLKHFCTIQAHRYIGKKRISIEFDTISIPQ